MTTVEGGKAETDSQDETAVKTDEAIESQPEKLVDPEDVAKDPKLLTEAKDLMATLDVLVCGQCHTAFHFVEEFQEHKNGTTCTMKSPVRDSNEVKTQVWAFLLWKCSSAREASSTNGEKTWDLYQQWCRMPIAQRDAWVAAGAYVQTLSRYSQAKELKPEPPAEKKKPATRPPKRPIKMDDSETQPSGEESEPTRKAKQPKLPQKTPLQKAKELIERESVRNAQERVPPEQRIARRTEEGCDPADAGEFVVEKILAKRFNPRRKQYEYLLKWEGYPHDQNTWEPLENMETCKNLLDAFEKQLARQKELKALKAQQQQQQQQQAQAKAKPTPTPTLQLPKKVEPVETPTYTPTGRLNRTSKARALDQVKAWCGVGGLNIKQEDDSDDEFSDSYFKLADKKPNVNGSPMKETPEKNKGMPNIKGVIKVDPKHMPNLSTGVYVMSKSSGIMKIDSPGKLGPNLNIDQDIIRKQIMAAKQKKLEETKKAAAPPKPSPQTVKRVGQQVIEKTIITPSGQKIIQRTIQRQSLPSNAPSPANLLNKKLQQGDSLLRQRVNVTNARGGGAVKGRSFTVTNAAIRVREKSVEFKWEESSESSDGIEDPFPRCPGPLPSPSPERELTLDPETGRRLARAEGEPTPPPTPPPEPDTKPEPTTPTTTTTTTTSMKVEMSPGGTTGRLVPADGAQPSLPVLTDDDGVKIEASAVKQLLEGGVDEGEEVNLLQPGHPPIMIRGEDGVLYQVAGENEAGQTLLVAAEGVETADSESESVMYVTREDGQEVLAIEPSQLAQLMPGMTAAGEGSLSINTSAPLQQVAVQLEGDGDDSTQVIAQLVQADLPSPGGTRRVVLLLPDGSFTMTELDKEQYEAITEAGKAE